MKYFNFKSDNHVLSVCHFISEGKDTNTIVQKLLTQNNYTEEELERFPQLDAYIRNLHEKPTIREVMAILKTLIPVVPLLNSLNELAVDYRIYSFTSHCYVMDKTLMHQAFNVLSIHLSKRQRSINLFDSKFTAYLSVLGTNNNPSLDKTSLTYIKAKNGLVNVHTKELTPYSPEIFITSHTETVYNPNINNTKIADLLLAFVDYNEERYILAQQIILTAVMGRRLTDSLIWVIGKSGSGKSVFSQLIIAMISGKTEPNHLVATIPFSEIHNSNKAEKLLHAQVQIGEDVDDKKIIRKTQKLKSLSSGNIVNLNLKYKRQTTPLTFYGPMIQNCSSVPCIAETTNQISRRSVVLKAEHDFTADKNKMSPKEIQEILNDPDNRTAFLNQLIENASDLLKTNQYNTVDCHEVKELILLEDINNTF